MTKLPNALSATIFAVTTLWLGSVYGQMPGPENWDQSQSGYNSAQGDANVPPQRVTQNPNGRPIQPIYRENLREWAQGQGPAQQPNYSQHPANPRPPAMAPVPPHPPIGIPPFMPPMPMDAYYGPAMVGQNDYQNYQQQQNQGQGQGQEQQKSRKVVPALFCKSSQTSNAGYALRFQTLRDLSLSTNKNMYLGQLFVVNQDGQYTPYSQAIENADTANAVDSKVMVAKKLPGDPERPCNVIIRMENDEYGNNFDLELTNVQPGELSTSGRMALSLDHETIDPNSQPQICSVSETFYKKLCGTGSEPAAAEFAKPAEAAPAAAAAPQATPAASASAGNLPAPPAGGKVIEIPSAQEPVVKK